MHEQEQAIGRARLTATIALTAGIAILAGIGLGNILVAIAHWAQ
jgi:hypothetical protein